MLPWLVAYTCRPTYVADGVKMLGSTRPAKILARLPVPIDFVILRQKCTFDCEPVVSLNDDMWTNVFAACIVYSIIPVNFGPLRGWRNCFRSVVEANFAIDFVGSRGNQYNLIYSLRLYIEKYIYQPISDGIRSDKQRLRLSQIYLYYSQLN